MLCSSIHRYRGREQTEERTRKEQNAANAKCDCASRDAKPTQKQCHPSKQAASRSNVSR